MLFINDAIKTSLKDMSRNYNGAMIWFVYSCLFLGGGLLLEMTDGKSNHSIVIESSRAEEVSFEQQESSSVCVRVLLDVQEIVDGDTLKADVHLPWNITLRRQRIRCAGFDAWERNRYRFGDETTEEEIRKGKIAARALASLFGQSDRVIIVSSSKSRDRYGRLLGELYVEKSSEVISVARWMEANGHTREEHKE